MPLPPGLCRVNVNASLQGGEIMVHTLHYKPVAPADFYAGAGSAQVVADAVVAAWPTFLNDPAGPPAGGLSVGTTYTDVGAYILDAGGRSVAQAAAAFPPNVTGLSGTSLPLQLAMAVSLSTELAGRRGKGRVYLGGLAPTSLGALGRFQPDFCDGVAESFANFVTALAAAGHQLVVASQTANQANPVTTVRVGDVPDVQRRRRNALRETYAVRPV